MLRAENISKSFVKNNKEFLALNNISFQLDNAEIYGLIGLNGAGKTTLLRLLSGIYNCTSGFISYEDIDIRAFNMANPYQISYLSSDTQVYQRLTIREYLGFFAKIKELPKMVFEERLKEYSSKLKLTQELNTLLEHTSTGTRQKAAFISAIINHPKYLFLDEPFANIDILMVDEMINTINALRDHGTSVIISSHNLYEIETIADKVIYLENGQIKLNSSIQELHKESEGQRLRNIILCKMKEAN